MGISIILKAPRRMGDLQPSRRYLNVMLRDFKLLLIPTPWSNRDCPKARLALDFDRFRRRSGSEHKLELFFETQRTPISNSHPKFFPV